MHTEIRHSPSFAVARVTLEPNEQLRAESGAMMADVGRASACRRAPRAAS